MMPFLKRNGKSQCRRNMNLSKKSKAQVQTTFAAAAVCALMIGLASTLCSAAPPADAQPAQTNSVALNAKTPVTDANNIEVKRQLTGAELYSMNCNRCHQERYPTERTGAQWKTIMLHMQVRANIPVSQARLILQYLQDNSGR
ncbi:MAG TPA: hypothetical protein VMV89_12760 [Candidatus Paceibacterota bacterium]|nr:hypothetical protein [Candidatus Paceibacterota bacterium]